MRQSWCPLYVRPYLRGLNRINRDSPDLGAQSKIAKQDRDNPFNQLTEDSRWKLNERSLNTLRDVNNALRLFALSGFALVWLFRTSSTSSIELPAGTITPLILLGVYCLLDVIHLMAVYLLFNTLAQIQANGIDSFSRNFLPRLLLVEKVVGPLKIILIFLSYALLVIHAARSIVVV